MAAIGMYFDLLDDPVPALKIFIRSSIYAAILVFIYAYGIFPHYHRILGVSRCISPLYYVLCDVVFTPAFACIGLPLIMSTIMGLNLQNRYLMDQITFFDASLQP